MSPPEGSAKTRAPCSATDLDASAAPTCANRCGPEPARGDGGGAGGRGAGRRDPLAAVGAELADAPRPAAFAADLLRRAAQAPPPGRLVSALRRARRLVLRCRRSRRRSDAGFPAAWGARGVGRG